MATKSFFCAFCSQVANMLYYNPALTLGVLHNTGLGSTVFDLWFQMLQQKKKSGLAANFKRYF